MKPGLCLSGSWLPKVIWHCSAPNCAASSCVHGCVPLTIADCDCGEPFNEGDLLRVMHGVSAVFGLCKARGEPRIPARKGG